MKGKHNTLLTWLGKSDRPVQIIASGRAARASSGMISGVAGALYSYHQGFIGPGNMGPGLSTQAVIYCLLGGSGTLIGPVIGTAVIEILTYVLADIESIRQFLSWLTNTELFSPELYFLSHLPADMDSGETTAVVVMALVLSLLATLYPSWRAARLDPVEALRYE